MSTQYTQNDGNRIPTGEPAYRQDAYSHAPPPPPRKRRVWPYVLVTGFGALAVGIALTLVVVFLPMSLGLGGWNWPFPIPTQAAGPTPTAAPTAGGNPTPTLTPGEVPELGGRTLPYISDDSPVADIAEGLGPSIVGILNYRVAGVGQDQRRILSGSGSGIILTEDGYIVTNFHVVEGADALSILSVGGEEIEARLVGRDSTNDLAVLKVEETGLVPAPLGDSTKVRVGEPAIAMGNPLGSELAGTVTLGIISATNRVINVDGFNLTLLQTDAAINPGNSGGALINIRGEVIGINTLKTFIAGFDESGNQIPTEGIGFAIPMHVARPIIETIISQGSIVRPGIGVTLALVDADTAEQFEIPEGLQVMSVVSGGPAALAGIRVNDIIVSFEGNPAEMETFRKAITDRRPGDTLAIRIWRNGRESDVTLVIGDMNEFLAD